MKRLKQNLHQQWQPNALTVPAVDPDLPRLSGIERSAEVIRFTAQRCEHWLSPGGDLREYLKLNLRLGILLALPVIMVAPLVTLALVQLQAWITLLTTTLSSFVLFPLSVLLSILLVCGMLYIGRAILALRFRGQRRDPYY